MRIVTVLILPVLFLSTFSGCATNVNKEATANLKILKIETPYPKPNIMAMMDNMWVLMEPLSVDYYNKENKSEVYSIVVPAGFVTNLASMPKGFRRLAGKFHDLDTAAIVHDYLFWVQPCSNEGNGKRIADKLYRDTLKESENVSWLNGWIQWSFLKTGSWNAWNNNQVTKEKGESRFIPKNYLLKVTEASTWADFKGQCCTKQLPQDFNFFNDEICLIKPKER